MCDCLKFLISPWLVLWQRIYAGCCAVSFLLVPAEHVRLMNAATSGPHALKHHRPTEMTSMAKSSSNVASDHEGSENIKKWKTEGTRVSSDTLCGQTAPSRYLSGGSGCVASLFTKRGQKGINQDAMLLIEDFASESGTVFCGVFDGHGPHGHLVAKNVGDMLPRTLASCWQALLEVARRSTSSLSEEDVDSTGTRSTEGGDPISAWKDALMRTYKLVDRDLLLNKRMDSVSSGTTAVTLVKQGYDLILGNVGDSRAILGSTTEDGSLVAIQLTVDLKPDLPREAERIRHHKGRVFALENEPTVLRVWLPHLNAPGLAMTRALGDYCLKNHGVIADPVVSHRRLTSKDKFVVLATDGVWDVLSNEQVVEAVALAPARSSAGKEVVGAAMRAWKSNYMTSKMDDCAVVCLFLDYLADS